jgi:hypothetical protein
MILPQHKIQQVNPLAECNIHKQVILPKELARKLMFLKFKQLALRNKKKVLCKPEAAATSLKRPLTKKRLPNFQILFVYNKSSLLIKNPVRVGFWHSVTITIFSPPIASL